MEGFVEYKRTRGTTPAGPCVVIGKTGQILLNDAALALFSTEPTALKVLFNAKKKIVALKGAVKDEAGAFTLRDQKGTKSIGAKAALAQFGITHDERHVYEVSQVPDEDVITFSIR